MENKKLNLENFNELLMECIPKEKHRDLLMAEISSAYAMKVEAMEELVECLNQHRPYRDELKKVNNIDLNLNWLNEMLEEMNRRADNGRE